MAEEDKIIQKIQKLLALANSDNENEAKVAMNMANTLLLKHNLSMQQISGRQSDYQKKIAKESILMLAFYQKQILGLLTKYFFVKATVGGDNRSAGEKYIQLIGMKGNCEVAHYVFAFLDRAYPQLWAEYAKKNPSNRFLSQSYYEGLTDGIEEVLKATKLRVEEETGLILRKDEKLEEFVDKLTKGRTIRQNQRLETDDSVFEDGLNDGKKVTIRKPIAAEQNSAQILNLN